MQFSSCTLLPSVRHSLYGCALYDIAHVAVLLIKRTKIPSILAFKQRQHFPDGDRSEGRELSECQLEEEEWKTGEDKYDDVWD